MSEMRLLAQGLRFAEAPRWVADRLWFSDVHAYQLKTVNLEGEVQVVCDVPGRPSGLGVLPDGRMLMATALDLKLTLVQEDGDSVEVADLGALAQGLLNDMVVDGRGRAYVGDTGFNMAAGESPRPGRVIVWSEAEGARVAAEDVTFPNGCVVSADGSAFVIAETMKERISAFRIAEDGSLYDRRTIADLGSPPDGLCLDADGAFWTGMPHLGEFLRISPGGEVLQRVASAAPFAVACALGGPDRRTLFLCSADTDLSRLARGDTTGRIDTLAVDVPGAGWP
jgi:sugar lactone lactonase YvrE